MCKREIHTEVLLTLVLKMFNKVAPICQYCVLRTVYCINTFAPFCIFAVTFPGRLLHPQAQYAKCRCDKIHTYTINMGIKNSDS